mgnify:CR=1 FL=1
MAVEAITKEEYPLVKIKLNVDGKDYEVYVRPYERLIDVLRYKLGITSVKEGCGRGECGACTVIMNGKLVASCLTLAIRADGSKIVTSAGLAPEGKIHAVHKALLDVHAVQCGFCIPGVAVAIKWLLDKNPNPTDEEIKEVLSGHYCRCGNYIRFIKAVKLASKYIREGKVYFDLKEVVK